MKFKILFLIPTLIPTKIRMNSMNGSQKRTAMIKKAIRNALADFVYFSGDRLGDLLACEERLMNVNILFSLNGNVLTEAGVLTEFAPPANLVISQGEASKLSINKDDVLAVLCLEDGVIVYNDERKPTIPDLVSSGVIDSFWMNP